MQLCGILVVVQWNERYVITLWHILFMEAKTEEFQREFAAAEKYADQVVS